MKKFNSGNWTFDYDMFSQNGLVIQNVKHDNYNLAKDIRIAGIWVFPVDPNVAPVHLFLGTDVFDIIPSANGSLSYTRYTNFNAPPPFDIYTKRGLEHESGIQAKYKTKQKVFHSPWLPDDPNDALLYIEQSFIFTSYGKNPPHEPGAVLPASRVFPLIKFSYSGKRIKSIRIDYRFEPKLDLYLKEKDPLLDNGLKKLVISTFPMLGGVFRDNEALPTSAESLSVLFRAAEKPSLNEICSLGLKRGIPGEKITTPTMTEYGAVSETSDVVALEDATTWDSVHLWSNKNIAGKYIKKQISTPGAFHCFHLHWRWADIAGKPSKLTKKIIEFLSPSGTTAAGSDQFKGVKISSDIGGPLLDPKIPDQTIRFAITKFQDQVYENLSNKSEGIDRWDPDINPPSTKIYEELFFNPATNLPIPRDISKGERLLFWISFEIFKHDISSSSFEGTVFPHGFYFAHNIEPGIDVNPFAETIGKEIQNPTYTNPTWKRYPNGK